MLADAILAGLNRLVDVIGRRGEGALAPLAGDGVRRVFGRIHGSTWARARRLSSLNRMPGAARRYPSGFVEAELPRPDEEENHQEEQQFDIPLVDRKVEAVEAVRGEERDDDGPKKSGATGPFSEDEE